MHKTRLEHEDLRPHFAHLAPQTRDQLRVSLRAASSLVGARDQLLLQRSVSTCTTELADRMLPLFKVFLIFAAKAFNPSDVVPNDANKGKQLTLQAGALVNSQGFFLSAQVELRFQACAAGL